MTSRFAFGALLLPLFLAAEPAPATQGLVCRPVSGSGPTLSFVLAAGGGLAAASISERAEAAGPAQWRPVPVRQSWIDEHRVWVDLTDEQRMSGEGRLRAIFVRSGRSWHAAGTFVRSGRLYRVRCEEG